MGKTTETKKKEKPL